jgi:hypothetical protein
MPNHATTRSSSGDQVSGAVEEFILREIAAHEVRNSALLDRLLELGTPLDAPRLIDCHFWVPTREQADALITKLLEKGLTGLSAAPPRDNEPWSVEGRLSVSPDVVASRVFTEEFVRLAANFGGKYDGWGTQAGPA